MLELRSRKTSKQIITIVPLGLKPEPGGCGVTGRVGDDGDRAREYRLYGEQSLPPSLGCPLLHPTWLPEERMRWHLKKRGEACGRVALFLGWLLWRIKESCLSRLCNGDCGRRFAFVFLWEHSCQAIILHPVAL